MSKEERRRYRVKPDVGEGLEVTVRAGNEPAVDGKIHNASVDGVAIDFDLDMSPALPINGTVTVTLSSPELGEPVALTARVVHRSTTESAQRYGFEFDKAALENRASNKYVRLFNRRGAFRIDPLPEEPISVEIHPTARENSESNPSADPIPGTVKDVSATGIGVTVEPDADEALAACDFVGLQFHLPPDSTPVRLVAAIQNRRLLDGKMLCGLNFEPELSTDFAKEEQKVLDYIMHRQRQDAQLNVRSN